MRLTSTVMIYLADDSLSSEPLTMTTPEEDPTVNKTSSLAGVTTLNQRASKTCYHGSSQRCLQEEMVYKIVSPTLGVLSTALTVVTTAGPVF